MTSRRAVIIVPAALAALAIAAPAAAVGADGGDDVRREGVCSGRSEVSLRLRADDGEIRVEVELEAARRGSRWFVIVLHERRTAFRGTLRARGDSLRLRRSVRDWYGSDTFVVRASAGRETCRVSATLRDEGAARRDVSTHATRKERA
jgi:hypothetical protein